MSVTGRAIGEEFALLDDGRASGGGCWLLEEPVEVILCDAPQEVPGALAAIENGVARGLFAAGYFAYELGYVLEPKLRPLLPPIRPLPLLRFVLFRDAVHLELRDAKAWVRRYAAGSYTIGRLTAAMGQSEYGKAFAAAHALIAAGDIYQLNLTFPQRFSFSGDVLALYRDLSRRQHVRYGGLIAAGDRYILSLSPELFVRKARDILQVRPMKGTARRLASPAEDARQRSALAGDEKSRAENLMIVDLVRNDLSRLAPPGAVRVTDLFTIETLRTVHQMTSGVEARLSQEPPLIELLRALFPCGSVTGAPKIRAMEVIRRLECEPRGIYTGAVGMLAPGGRLLLNVAIRTIVIEDGRRGELGVGSGIVFDSDVDAEFAECRLKSEFLSSQQPPFSLIETLRWEREGGFVLLDRHLDRLCDSAAYFAIPCDRQAIREALKQAARSFTHSPARVRLLLDEEGEIAVNAAPMPPLPTVLRYAMAERTVSSKDPFRYHKTTRREELDSELARLRTSTGCHEVLFVNEKGELTEGAWTNLFLRRDGRLLTPPVSCGLVDGTLRRDLLARGDGSVIEAVLRPADLATAKGVFLGNSVRGLMPATPAALSR